MSPIAVSSPPAVAAAGSRFAVRMPRLVAKKAAGVITFRAAALERPAGGFLRFDLYPLIAPSHKRRHYGWWDIPLRSLRPGENPFVLDVASGTLRLTGGWRALLPVPRWKGVTAEEGYCNLHVSLWDAGGPAPRMTELLTLQVVITRGDWPPPLKQLNIPVTDRCNLKCTMCPRQGTQDLVERDIGDDILARLLEASGELSCVLLQGLGEPLLYRGLVPLIGRLKSRMHPDSEIGLTTNATLLDGEAGRRLLDSGVDFVYFSVDAARPATYASIRVGGVFREVVRNIERFARLRAGARPRLMMNFVITAENAPEIPEFVRLTAEVGVERVTFSRCLDQAGGESRSGPEDQLDALFREAAETAGRSGTAIDFPPVRRVAEERCSFMERAVVLGSGEVVPCHAMAPGYRARERALIFGSLREQSMREIWERREFVEFRRRVLAGDFPDACRGCMCKAYLVP